jgi:hypothetical protein
MFLFYVCAALYLLLRARGVKPFFEVFKLVRYLTALARRDPRAVAIHREVGEELRREMELRDQARESR